jgi:hypothetical protein
MDGTEISQAIAIFGHIDRYQDTLQLGRKCTFHVRLFHKPLVNKQSTS